MKVIKYTTKRPSFAAFIITFLLDKKKDFDFQIDTTGKLLESSYGEVTGNISIAEKILEEYKNDYMYKDDAEKKATEPFLKVVENLICKDVEKFEANFKTLEGLLADKKFICGDSLRLADIYFYEVVMSTSMFSMFQSRRKKDFPNVFKYYTLVDRSKYGPNKVTFKSAAQVLKKAVKKKESTLNLLSYMEVDKVFKITLPKAKMGAVVTRFPPEASGFIHIGHAKAVLVNWWYAKKYNGKMIFRFDDTNPEREKVEFEKGIIEDVHKLGVNFDTSKITYTSNYFDYFAECCEKLLKEGKAYVCDVPQEEFAKLRMDGIESRNRDNAVDKNLGWWEEMKKGSEKGQECCVRAKMDMKDPNRCCRDPVLYRVRLDPPHPHTGSKYKAYPTYDFACPIVDSIEGVTHTLRTSEYNDRDKQFYWINDALGLRNPIIKDYSRLNFTYTIMSKRKLRQLIASNFLDGWSDPRLPTVRALLRQGIQPEAIEKLILSQGASVKTATLEWNKLYKINKTMVDNKIPRFQGVYLEKAVAVEIAGMTECGKEKEITVHPKNKKMGKRKIILTDKILINQEDALFVKSGEEITLRHIGNVIVEEIKKDGDTIISMKTKFVPNGDFKKTEWKFTWVDADEKNTCVVNVVKYGNLLTKKFLEKEDDFMKFINKDSKVVIPTMVEKEISPLKKGEMFQIERIGNYIVDTVAEEGKKMSLIKIPENVVKKKIIIDGKKQTKKKHQQKGKKSNKKGKQGDSPCDIDIRVGVIESVEDHPNADTMYIEMINIGEEKPRQIISGLKGKIDKKDLIGKKVLVMINLKPSKLKRVMSYGMLMIATKDKSYTLLKIPDGAKAGDKVVFEGEEFSEPLQKVNPKKLKRMLPFFGSNDTCLVCFKEFPMKVCNEYIKSEKPKSVVS